jgi:isopenicillin N synthase-like dioxygenase
MEASLPIIDLAPYMKEGGDTKATATAIREACKKVGFFYVKNHGVPEELRKSFFESSKRFFDLPR